jgi:hypothetical protein
VYMPYYVKARGTSCHDAIQSVPGGQSIGHSKQKGVYVHVSYSERFPR